MLRAVAVVLPAWSSALAEPIVTLIRTALLFSLDSGTVRSLSTKTETRVPVFRVRPRVGISSVRDFPAGRGGARKVNVFGLAPFYFLDQNMSLGDAFSASLEKTRSTPGLPIAILAVTRLGIVTPKQLARNRRYAYLLIAVVAMALPGTDPVSMVLEMVPLIVLFEGSLGLARVVGTPSEADPHTELATAESR